MKSFLTHSLLASILLAVLTLLLTAPPTSASPVPRPLTRDVLPLSSPIPPSTQYLRERNIRNRAKILAQKLASERAAMVKRHRQETMKAIAVNQVRVDRIREGRTLDEITDQQRDKLGKLGMVLDDEINRRELRHVKEKNDLLNKQRAEVDKIETEWEAATGGKKELDVPGLEIPCYISPTQRPF